MASQEERALGRLAAEPIVDPKTGEIIIDRNEEIDEQEECLDLCYADDLDGEFVYEQQMCIDICTDTPNELMGGGCPSGLTARPRLRAARAPCSNNAAAGKEDII